MNIIKSTNGTYLPMCVLPRGMPAFMPHVRFAPWHAGLYAPRAFCPVACRPLCPTCVLPRGMPAFMPHVRFAPWHAGLYAPRAFCPVACRPLCPTCVLPRGMPAFMPHMLITSYQLYNIPAIIHACYFHNLLSTYACFVTSLI